MPLSRLKPSTAPFTEFLMRPTPLPTATVPLSIALAVASVAAAWDFAAVVDTLAEASPALAAKPPEGMRPLASGFTMRIPFLQPTMRAAGISIEPRRAREVAPSSRNSELRSPVRSSNESSSTRPISTPSEVLTSMPSQMMQRSQSRSRRFMASSSQDLPPMVGTITPSCTSMASSARNFSGRLIIHKRSGLRTIKPTTLRPSGENTVLKTLPILR